MFILVSCFWIVFSICEKISFVFGGLVFEGILFIYVMYLVSVDVMLVSLSCFLKMVMENVLS